MWVLSTHMHIKKQIQSLGCSSWMLMNRILFSFSFIFFSFYWNFKFKICANSLFSRLSFDFILFIFRVPSKLEFFPGRLPSYSHFFSLLFVLLFSKSFHLYSNLCLVFFSFILADYISLYICKTILKRYHIRFDYNHTHVCVGHMENGNRFQFSRLKIWINFKKLVCVQIPQIINNNTNKNAKK